MNSRQGASSDGLPLDSPDFDVFEINDQGCEQPECANSGDGQEKVTVAFGAWERVCNYAEIEWHKYVRRETDQRNNSARGSGQRQREDRKSVV